MRKLALIILDGWGIGEEKPNNAIHIAQTPFFDQIWKHYPHTQLQASSEFVGLPVGQIGGSEVGHLTIGAGRIIYQTLPRINKSLGELESEKGILSIKNFKHLLELAKRQPIHMIGQISTGGVHSHEDHLFKILEIMKQYGCKSPIIHFISDGRDTSSISGIKSAQRLIKKIHELEFGTVATMGGRFFFADRDMNLDRTKKAVDVLMGHGSINPEFTKDVFSNLISAFEETYKKEITDEFVEPLIIDPHFKGIKADDILFFFNFRNDRMKQLITMTKDVSSIPPDHIFTMTRYDKSYPFPVLFEKETISGTIGEVLSSLNLKQLKAAETEKAPHVTYFFNGGVEQIFQGERRAVAESNKVKHDVLPEMKAIEIHENIRNEVLQHNPEFILVNFANPDMVGHTGNFKAVVAGVQSVDRELKKLCEFLTKHNYICLITADHGNADIMYDLETKEPHTAHTLNPVPFIVYDPVDRTNQKIKLNQHPENGLSLIAGTALQLMELQKPAKNFGTLIISK